MIRNKEQIDEVVEKLRRLLPDDVNLVRDDINQKLKATLTASLKNMDLVTREEFDIQSRLLAKTRARLEELQSRINELEQTLKSS